MLFVVLSLNYLQYELVYLIKKKTKRIFNKVNVFGFLKVTDSNPRR